MDIVRSEIGYLGYHNSESYGLTWKVRGFCKDKSNLEVFDNVKVTGDIIDSNIHHLFFGVYTYGHQGGTWTGNLMHDNAWYGFDPHDDSDYLTIHDNTVWNNGKHGIIASKRCNHVSIQNNVVHSGGETAAGVMLHRSSDDAIVYKNTIYNMQDAGIAFFESFRGLIMENSITNCRLGIRLSMGSANNQIFGNYFDDIAERCLYTYEGTDEPEVGGGRPYENYFCGNEIQNADAAIFFKNSDDLVVIGNTFEESTNTMEFDDAENTVMIGNVIHDDLTFVFENKACIEETDIDFDNVDVEDEDNGGSIFC
ncbi:unnamed protein product [Discosporangium mesarthrocarpum]